MSKLTRASVIVAPARTPSTADFKTLDPAQVGNQYKFVFIIDESGSNVNDSAFPGGSDPTGARRFDNIVRFVDMQVAQGATGSYAMAVFNDTGILVRPFTSDTTAFRNAVLAEKAAKQDSGGTNYTEALSRFQDAILSDATACVNNGNVAPTYYVGFFLSDGIPNPAITDAELQNLTNTIDTIAATNVRCVNGVTLHTGYYHGGPADNSSPEAQIMQRLAALGHGQFIDFADGGVIDLTRFQIPNVQVQIRLVDVLIENRNTVWEDGLLKLDTDMDGLSDELETRIKSKTTDRDSDSNGVSDFVEYYLYGTPCTGVNKTNWTGSCSPVLAQDFNLACGNLRISPAGAIPVRFRDSDGLGFNDCEKRLLGGRTDRWDSNGDWIPDALEFFRGMNFIPGTHQENADPFNNGITNREKLKRGMPIDVDARTIPTFKPFDYTLFQTAKDARGTSYSVEIKNIPIIGQGNTVRVYIFESTLGVKDRRYARFADKRISSEDGVSIINSDFSPPKFFDCSTLDPCF